MLFRASIKYVITPNYHKKFLLFYFMRYERNGKSVNFGDKNQTKQFLQK